MKLKNIRNENAKQGSLDTMTLMLILSVLFVLVNVILTVNGLSPFQFLK